MKLKDSSRTHIFINNFPTSERIHILKPRKQLLALAKESTDIFCKTKLFYYTIRPKELENLTVVDFFSQYSVDKIKENANSNDSINTDCSLNSSVSIENTFKMTHDDVKYKKTPKKK